MSNETCPHCGAEMAYDDPHYMRFKCGALVWGDGSTSYAESECLKRQIKQRDAEIERLRKELSRIYVHSRDGTNGECEYCNWSSDTAFDALKEVK